MKDYIKECNNLGSPEEEFVRIWCSRCKQASCVRAQGMADRFEQRVKTWEDRLFLKVPRMSEHDPRFAEINKQAFAPVDSWEPKSILVPKQWGESDEVVVKQSQEAAPKEEPNVAPKEKPPARFFQGPIPNQSGRSLREENIIKPGARIRLGKKDT